MLDSDSDEDEGEKDLYVSSTEQQPQSSDSPESLEFDQSIQSIGESTMSAFSQNCKSLTYLYHDFFPFTCSQ